MCVPEVYPDLFTPRDVKSDVIEDVLGPYVDEFN